MIGALQGKIAQRSGEHLIIDVHGVGYLVTASAGVLSAAGPVGEPISVIVHTDVKENAITLYAFSGLLEKKVFQLLKKVKGIGSRLSLTILSGMGAEALLSAIGQEDIAALQKVSGVGKKTAERLVVELREYVGDLVYQSDDLEGDIGSKVSSNEKKSSRSLSDAATDAALALEKLGFSTDRARAAINIAAKEYSEKNLGKEADASEILRLSLAKL